jgi:hypothetical protein
VATSPEPSAVASVAEPGPYRFESPGLAADVQSWLESPGEDFGWILIGDETGPTTSKRFASRESEDPAVAPALVIRFERRGGACADAVARGPARDSAAYCEALTVPHPRAASRARRPRSPFRTALAGAPLPRRRRCRRRWDRGRRRRLSSRPDPYRRTRTATGSATPAGMSIVQPGTPLAGCLRRTRTRPVRAVARAQALTRRSPAGLGREGFVQPFERRSSTCGPRPAAGK